MPDIIRDLCGINPEMCRIVKKSIDSRRGRPEIIYKLVIQTGSAPNNIKADKITPEQAAEILAEPEIEIETLKKQPRQPVVVGTGPAGIFAGLVLALAGAKPLILDRGKNVDERAGDIDEFYKTRTLNEESNYLIGEGGAGTFSDGKLYTRNHDPRGAWVLAQFAGAGADYDTAGFEESLLVVDNSGELHFSQLRMKTSLHGSPQSIRLLVYLLEHEMGETALLYLTQVEFQFLDNRSDLNLTQVGNTYAASSFHNGYLLVIQIDDPVGILNYRSRVRTDEEFILADTHDQRTALAGRYHSVWIVLVYYHNGICAYHIPKSERYCLHKGDFVRVHHILDQLDDHFRVGIAVEMVPFVDQLLLQSLVILDNTVVNQSQVLVLRIMRMRIDIVRLPVGCPSGMRDADSSGSVLVADKLLQVTDFSFGLIHRKNAIGVDKSYAGTVIASVFQPVKSFDQDGGRLFLAHVSYNSTHSFRFLKKQK